MAKKIIKAQMKQRQDTKANWAAANPVLLDGELGMVSDDRNLYKVGDGRTAWNDLPFRGFDGTLAQELGTSPNAAISQKAVTEKLTELSAELVKVQDRTIAELESMIDIHAVYGYYINSAGGKSQNGDYLYCYIPVSSLKGKMTITTTDTIIVSFADEEFSFIAGSNIANWAKSVTFDCATLPASYKYVLVSLKVATKETTSVMFEAASALNVSLIPSFADSGVGAAKANIFLQSGKWYLDFGSDPVFLVGSKQYILKNLHSSTSEYRTIMLKASDSETSAVKLVFNTETAKFKAIQYSASLGKNEVLVGGIRQSSTFIAVNFPFEYTINGKEVWVTEEDGEEVDLSAVLKARNVTFIPSPEAFPNFDTVSNTLDLGEDPVFIVGGEQFAMMNLHYSSTFRSIPVGASGATAEKMVFNLSTKKPYFKYWRDELSAEEVVVGGLRIKNGEIKADVPFFYTINKTAVWDTPPQSIRIHSAVECIAHRGVHLNNIPENSLDAYRYAARCGFKYVETDFSVTSDGHLVIMHDATINRTMKNADNTTISSAIYVNQKTLAELRNNYILDSSDARMRRQIPTLEEFLIECRNGCLFPILEIKGYGMTNEKIKEAHDLACGILGEGNFGFCGSHPPFVDYARSLSESTIIAYIVTNGILGTTNTVTGKSRVSPTTWWYPSYDPNSAEGDWGVDIANVRAHRAAGVKVAVWTVPVSWFDNMLKKEVDFISSDYVAPSINGISGKVAKSDNGFSAFTTNGTTSNNSLILTTGQTCSFAAPKMWLGGYYLRIVGKGAFSVSLPNLNDSISSSDIDSFVYQGLVNNSICQMIITASAQSEIQYIEFSCAEF